MVISLALAPTRDVKGSFIRLLPTRARNGAEMRGKRSICFKKMRVECHLANLLSYRGVKEGFIVNPQRRNRAGRHKARVKQSA